MTLRLGLDLHGVIDEFPEKFCFLAKAVYLMGGEVHIITGLKRTPAIWDWLNVNDIRFTHYYSIVDDLEDRGVEIVWDEHGFPHAPDDLWDVAKAEYCVKHKIDLMIDDSGVYKETFNDIETTYLHLINPHRSTRK